MKNPDRRSFLAGVAAVGALGVSGCLGGGGGPEWTAEVGSVGPLSAGPVESGNNYAVYAGTEDALYAIDEGGETVWTYEEFDGAFDHAPTRHPRQLCIGASDGVHAVGWGGEQLWAYTDVSGASGRPAVVEEGVFAVAGGALHVLDFETGTRRDRVEVPFEGSAWTGVAGDSLLLAGEERLVAVSRDDHTERWTHPLQLGTLPAVFGSNVAVASRREGGLAVLDLSDGTTAWTGIQSGGLRTPYFHQTLGELCVTDAASKRVARYTSEGERQWVVIVEDAGSLSRPSRGPAGVFVVDHDAGRLYTLSAPDGDVSAEHSVGPAANHAPLAEVDYVYAPTTEGVAAVEI